MRNPVPVKIFTFSHLRRFVLQSTLIYITSMVLLFATLGETSSFAARRIQLQHPIPFPSPAIDLASAESLSATPFFIFLSMFLGGIVFYLIRKNEGNQNAFDREATKLEAERDAAHEAKAQVSYELSQIKNVVDRCKADFLAQKMELSKAENELREVKSRIKQFLLADPEIEVKAKKASDTRAKIQAERDKIQEAEAHRKQIKELGAERVDDLLAEMKRGY